MASKKKPETKKKTNDFIAVAFGKFGYRDIVGSYQTRDLAVAGIEKFLGDKYNADTYTHAYVAKSVARVEVKRTTQVTVKDAA